MKRSGLIFVALFLVGASLYYLINRPSRKPKDSINLAVNTFSKTFDPAIAFNDDSLTVLGQSLESLYQYHYLKRPFEVIPALAEGMPKISPDGLIYTIEIKKGVFYHPHKDIIKPNREVIVDDFILQIKRLAFKPLKSTGTWLFEGKLKGFEKFREAVGSDFTKLLMTDLEGVKKVNKYTFEIHLTRPEPNLIYFLAMTFITPVPLELVEAYKNDLTNVMVGTGPYIFEGIENRVYKYKKNPNFREEFYPTEGDRDANTSNLVKSSRERLPFIENLRIHVVTNEDERWQAFLKGELDILDVPKKFLSEVNSPTTEELQQFDNKGIEIKHFPSQSNRWLSFNMNDPILGKNLLLRKAIAYGINFERYIEVLTKNTNLRSNSIYNPSINGYNPSHQPPYEYDLELAKKYLKQAGYKPGELTLTYSTRGTQEIHYKEGEFLQAQLGELGINLKIEVITFSEFLKLGRAGELQFFTDSWIYDYPDSENLIQLLISKNHPGINKSGYSNQKVDQLYNRLSRTLIKDRRLEIMREVEKEVEQDLPWILLAYDSAYVVNYQHVDNYRKSFFSRNYVKYLETY